MINEVRNCFKVHVKVYLLLMAYTVATALHQHNIFSFTQISMSCSTVLICIINNQLMFIK